MDYSEFRVTNASIKFGKDVSASKFGCIGSIEETLNTKKISKKCEGIIVKNRTKPDGSGELKISLHMEQEAYYQAFGMNATDLKTGIKGYGKLPHEEFCLTMEVFDEDDIKKYKAYPNCVFSDGISRKIENGAEEVAEIEATLLVAADVNGYCMYEALAEGLEDDVKEKWLTAFTPELVKKVDA